MAREDLPAGTELLCDYGYIKQYQQSQDLFKTVLDIGAAFTDSDDIGNDMKHTVKYLKRQVDDYKPYFDMAKNLYNLWFNSL